MIVIMAAMLLPTLSITFIEFLPGGVSRERSLYVHEAFSDIVGQMASFYLLPALGFCLALRRGVVDLSIWASAGLGGVVAASLINAGLAPAAAFACAAGAGLIVGGLNAVAVGFTKRIPTWLITLAVAALATWVAGGITGGTSPKVSQETFSRWHIVRQVVITDADEKGLSAPEDSGAAQPQQQVATQRRACSPATTRMLLVAAVYATTMFAMILWSAIDRRRKKACLPQPKPSSSGRLQAVAALLASGAIAAVGGAIWLIEHSAAPLPTRLIGDLRLPVAAVLAGAILLAGPGRSLFTCLLLPISLLLATVWRQEIRPWQWLPAWGYCFQLLELLGMVLTIQFAFRVALTSTARRRQFFMGACGFVAAAGLAVASSQVMNQVHDVRFALHLAGVIIWLCAAAALAAEALLRAALLLRDHPRAPLSR